MNYIKIETDSIENGTGVRVVLWISGCTLYCPGCHNSEAWDFGYGKRFDDGAKQELFQKLSKPYIDGITLSGGHPLESNNIEDVYRLVYDIKKNFPEKTIWIYTGLSINFEDFKGDSLLSKILCKADVIVDGMYYEPLRDITLPFRGSSNQRIIDVKKTLEYKKVIELSLD